MELEPQETPIAVYVHTPFCPTKCGYCDFNSYAMDGAIVERTVTAIVREIESSHWAGRPAKTIFFGGGTPTFLSSVQIGRLLRAVFEVHPPVLGAEITSEANPGTVDIPKFAAMRRAGFNRISLGAQSFLDSDLVRLGRVHRSGEIETAVTSAREAGFNNLNLDLMFALPGQSPHAWRSNLDRAMALKPEHLSLYCLTIEPNTAFFKEHLRGQLVLPDEDEQVAMYEECLDRMATEGLIQYEISNFARPGRLCEHNMCYWSGEEYAGYGPGAVGRVGNRRYTNLKHPVGYSSAVENALPLAYEEETLTPDTYRIEAIMLGLRLNNGFDAEFLRLDRLALTTLENRGWLEQSGPNVRLTRLGRHFCSEAALELI